MRGVVLILLLVAAFYARVNCEESAAPAVKTSELIEASVKGGERHEDEDKDKDIKKLTKQIDLLRLSLLAHQRQFAESQQTTKMLQIQLQSEKAIVDKLQQQASKLLNENVKNGEKHQTQDKDYANLLVEIQQLQSKLTTHEQRLQACQTALEASQQLTSMLQSQLQSDNSTLVELQKQVSDLAVASAKSEQKHQTQDMDYANQLLQIQQLKLNLSSNQEQLDESKLQTSSIQTQLQSNTMTIELLQRQILDLIAANVTAVQAIQLLKVNVSSNQQQLQESKVQTTSLQSQLENKTATIDLVQSRVSDLIAANVTAVQSIQLLQSNLSSYQKQQEDSKVLTTSLQTQLDNKTATIAQLQRQMSDLIAANVTAALQLQQLNMNVTSQLNQLTALRQGPAIQWVPWNLTDALPKNALLGGLSWDNIPIYIARTNISNTAAVVRACPTTPSAIFTFYGTELSSTKTEVLTGSGFSWKWGANGNVPDNAVPVGKDGSGSLYYIGRVQHANNPYGYSIIPGTIIGGYGGGIYISFNGKEIYYNTYQVLIHD